MKEDNLLSLSYGRIVRRDVTGTDGLLPESFETYQIVNPGDLVFRLTDLQNDKKSLRSGLVGERGIITSAYVAATPRGLDPRFASYLMRSYDTTKVFYGMGGGVRQSLKFSDLSRMPVLAPPKVEQAAIADFLDRETARIDTLIEKQEKLIETLRERRRAVISSATIGGENPLVNGRSGKFVPVGFEYSVVLGKMLDAGKAPREGDKLLPYIRAANIQDGGLSLDNVNSMRFSDIEASILDLRSGDLLVVEGGAVGTNVVLEADLPGWSFQKTVNRVRSRDGWSTRYLSYVLLAYRDAGVIDVICNKSTIPHYTAEKLVATPIPVRSLDDQADIVAHLDWETLKIDTLIAKAERFIELAKERRSTLITAAVTGQIEVGEVAVG